MQIERMNENHIDDVYLISLEEFKENSWSKNLFIKELQDNKFKDAFVGIKNNQVVGFVNLCFNDEEMTILNLATKSAFKRQNVAKMLMQTAFEVAKNKSISRMFLEVEVDNFPAINLYKKFGFEVLKIRKNYYPNHHDALEMIKYLSG